MLADRNIFGSLMTDLHNVESVETAIYKEVTADIIQEWPLAGIVYLRCRPETCFLRIKKRNRHEEEEVPLEYLQLVHEKHESWIGGEGEKSRVLVIDTDYYDVTVGEDQQRIIALVRGFIEKVNGNM
jgi:deoxyadenosine/deoxycytidine kinase